MSIRSINASKLPGGKFINEAVNRLSEAQSLFKTFVDKNASLAKEYAHKGQEELKSRIQEDLVKVQKLIEKERKDLEALQRQIPKEMGKISKFLVDQTKEVTKVLGTIKVSSKAAKRAPRTSKKAPLKVAKSAATAKRATSKSSGRGVKSQPSV